MTQEPPSEPPVPPSEAKETDARRAKVARVQATSRAREAVDPAPSTSAPDDDGRLQGAYVGQSNDLFRLALKTALLTALTLGIYRFWERTRIRRYIWSATAPGGDPFEYTGTGKEKFLGFLIAVVILGLGLGVIQIGLTFVGLSVFSGAENEGMRALQIGLLQLSVVAMLPLYGFAQYRAYRYRMARTRWRGVRFGVEAGAWGYAWRYCVYVLLTIVSLGILSPLMKFKLEAYKTNRTYYGTAKLVQEGNWKMLYPAMTHIFWPLGLSLLVVFLWGFTGFDSSPLALIVTNFWLMIGLVHYRVQSFALLTRHKVLDGVVRFDANPSTGTVLGKTLVGGLATGFLVFVTIAILLLLANGFGILDFARDGLTALFSPSLVQSILSLLGTLVMLQLYGVFGLIFVLQPIYDHMVSSVWVQNPIHLTAIRQRAETDQVDADGFADALDVGGAF